MVASVRTNSAAEDVSDIREIKIRVYGKRQTSDSSLRFLKINNKYARMVQNNFYVYG